MQIRALALLAALSPFAAALCHAQTQPSGAAQAPSQQQGAGQNPSDASAPVTGQTAPDAGNYKYFFTATGSAFEAYYDSASMKAGDDGYKQVSVKLTKFSATFRSWIGSNFPGGQTAEYAIDSYSIDCDGKKVGEHQITWYDSSGTELTDYDFGGALSAPITYSMKDNLMRKVCGLP